MDNATERVITIHPNSKRHTHSFIWLGCISLFILSLLSLFLWQTFKIQLIFLISATLVIILIGILKCFEPGTSFFITPKMIIYCHRTGQWTLPWQDIIRFGELRADVQGEHVQLPYVGIKLNNLEHIAKNISPRLANKLIHEQQELLMLAITNKAVDFDGDDSVINFEPYTLNEIVYKGPIAAWLHRSEQLAKAYGYHLYLPESSLDRNLNHFLTLLKKCHHYTIVNGPY